jgi:DNA-directed RNA polymerase specialized sigma subunit
MTEQERLSLYTSHLKLAGYLSRKWCLTIPRPFRDDVNDAARFALWRACRLYDPNKKVKFSTFAYTVIQREIIKYYWHLKRNSIYCRSLNESGINGDEMESGSDIKLYDNALGYTVNYDANINTKEIISIVRRYKYLPYIILDGYKSKDLALMFNVSNSLMSYRIIRERKHLIRKLYGMGLVG